MCIPLRRIPFSLKAIIFKHIFAKYKTCILDFTDLEQEVNILN